MRLQDFYILIIPVALDWVWDKISSKKATKVAAIASENARKATEKQLREALTKLGEAGERIAKEIEENVPDNVSPEVSKFTRKLRSATDALRITTPPPHGDKKHEQ